MLRFLVLVIAGWAASNGNAFATERAIFGADDRRDYFELNEPIALRTTAATAVMVYGPNLEWDFLQEEFKLQGPTHAERHGACSDVKFADQPSGGLCSGFLIGQDILVTAGHCVQWEHDCSNNNWVFGYAVSRPGKPKTRFDVSDVYWCKQVLAQEHAHESKRDFAVIRLDRAVEGRAPLPIRQQDPARTGEPVGLAGYPGGLPVKWVGQGQVTGEPDSDTFLVSTDAFGGNSGSPVVRSATGEVEGILIAGGGHEDWIRDSKLGCNRPRLYEESAGHGIEIQRIHVIDGAF